MISIYVPNESKGIQAIDVATLRTIMAGDPSKAPRIWIDLNEPTEEEEDQILAETMKFHPLAILDCRRERLSPEHGDHLPKVEDYGRYLFSIINPIELKQNPQANSSMAKIITQQLNVFLGETFIVTHHYEPSHAVSKVISTCTKNQLHLQRGPDYVYHLILDNIVDEYSPILDVFDEEIDLLEDEIFGGSNQRTLSKILNMKRQVFNLRKITTYQREMVYRLSRGEFELITADEIAYYRNVFDHLVRATELAESYRDILTGLVDAYLSMASNRMNEIMKVLAIISTFFLPLTFIAGVYGMNFDPDVSPFNMPELRWIYGYPFAWGVMIAMAVVMFMYFRRKKWL
jgi:magnesium transporter